MDSLRHVPAESDGVYDDAAIEAPPVVGTDERRMQVRAYNHWAAMLGDRAYPSIEDLDIERLDDFGPNAVLLDFTSGIENPGVTFVGDRIAAECNLPDDIHYINQVPSRSLLSRLTDHYLQIIANRAPIGFEAEFVNDRDVAIMYRGILLPFSSDDDTIDFILGVINWKEAVAAPQADELVLEVEQALRSAPSPTAPMPMWADGPTSGAQDRIAPLPHAGKDDEDEPLLEPGFDALGDMPNLIDRMGGAGPAAVDPLLALTQIDATEALDDDASLADWLAAARTTAADAQDADARSRGALYQAVGRAHDFALAADTHPEDYAELLADAGLKAQARAPMTPVVKLVFGVEYDKTRLAEYATVLAHARDAGIERGALAPYLERYAGGLKGLVRDERAKRRPARAERPDPSAARLDALRTVMPMGVVEYAGEEEFVLLVARRLDDGHVAVVAGVESDPALLSRALDRVITKV